MKIDPHGTAYGPGWWTREDEEAFFNLNKKEKFMTENSLESAHDQGAYDKDAMKEWSKPEAKADEPALTFGMEAVGIKFNPGGDPDVNKAKHLFAQMIDGVHLDTFIEHCNTILEMVYTKVNASHNAQLTGIVQNEAEECVERLKKDAELGNTPEKETMIASLITAQMWVVKWLTLPQDLNAKL